MTDLQIPKAPGSLQTCRFPRLQARYRLADSQGSRLMTDLQAMQIPKAAA